MSETDYGTSTPTDPADLETPAETAATEPEAPGLVTSPVGGFNENRLFPTNLTAVDAQGVERITGPDNSDWVPAPVEPSEEAVAAAEERLNRTEEARQERLSQLGLQNPEA